MNYYRIYIFLWQNNGSMNKHRRFIYYLDELVDIQKPEVPFDYPRRLSLDD